ncbi:MAG: hypothetical protein ABIY37_17465 [Devosia sp.]
MTPLEWFVAAGLPLLIVVAAFIAMKIFQWDMKRRHRMHPGE